VSIALKLETYGAPEAALLLAASGGNASSASVRQLMQRGIDWTLLTRLAVESHATVGLWDVISGFPDLPAETQVLQSLAVVNDFRRHHIRNLVARVTRELAQGGIEVLALKGAALLAGGVSRPIARTMSDIDLLVLNGSPDRAWELCRQNGWALVDETWTREMYREHHHLPPLIDPDGINIGLELHRTLLPGLSQLGVDVGGIIARSRIVTVGNTPVRVPSVEDLLLHACLHFAWSNKLRHAAWRAFSDAHAIIADPAFDWDRFLATARSRRARLCCYWTLRLGRAVADLDVPDDVMTRLDPSSGGRIAMLLERHFAIQLADQSAEEEIAERLHRWLWLAALRERSSRDAKHILSLGALEVPRPRGEVSRPPRRALVAAVRTVGYFARLVSHG
jgi:hypothetical protein